MRGARICAETQRAESSEADSALSLRAMTGPRRALGPEHRFRSHVVGPVLAHAREHGVEIGPLLRELRLPADAMTSEWIELTRSTLLELFARIEAESGDPALGVHVGQRLSRSIWDLMQLSCMSAPTLMD